MTKPLALRVTALEEKVAALEGGRPGRKPLPVIVSLDGVCGVDPERDSASCPDASLYRRQRGCKGVACKEKSATYYQEYRDSRKPKKRSVKRKRLAS